MWKKNGASLKWEKGCIAPCIVFEVVKKIYSIITQGPLEYIASDSTLNQKDIEKEFNLLKESYNILIHQGLCSPPSEVAMTSVQEKIRVVGVLLNEQVPDIEKIPESAICPIEKWLDDHKIDLHSSWKPDSKKKNLKRTFSDPVSSIQTHKHQKTYSVVA
jgi:hypothetical protein